MQVGNLSLKELQARGWVSQTPQLSHGIGWGYKILQYNAMFGCMAFSSSIWSQKELTNPETQKQLFARFES